MQALYSVLILSRVRFRIGRSWVRALAKGVKNGTGSSLADARNKRVVLGRYKNAGRYLLLVMSQ